MVVGSLIGGLILDMLPATQGYRVIFTASAALRLLSLTALFGVKKISVRFRILAFFSTTVERDHVDFAHDAINFYSDLAARKGLNSIPLPTGTKAAKS